MARYVVQHDYRSGSYGPYDAGSEVELEPAQAEWINHDSPGALKLKDAPADDVVVAEPAEEPAEEPESDVEPGSVSEANRPAVNDPKAAWVDWAVDSGSATRVEAEQMTKADLQAL